MLDDTEDVALNFGDESAAKQKRFKHPVAAFFHIIFRLLALLFYFLANLMTNSFITMFVVLVLLLSFDFWVVKNVTGRLLVGLRWWNYIDEDGNSQWMFESRKKKKGAKSKTLAAESRLFWLGLVIFPVIWIFLLVVALLSFKLTNIIIIFVAIVLTASNLVGYVRCKKDAGKDVKSMATKFLGRQILTQMFKSNAAKEESKTETI